MTVYMSWQPPDTPLESHWSHSKREELRDEEGGEGGGAYHAYLILGPETKKKKSTVSGIESSGAAHRIPGFQG
jgi:hypothetical protein